MDSTKRIYFSIFCAVVTYTLLFYSGGSASPLRVFVSIPPQAYFVEKIGGRHVTVQILVKPGQDPHTFNPTPGQVVSLGRADIYFTIDLPFERRLVEKIGGSQQHMMIIDTARGIEKRRMNHGYGERDEKSGHGKGEIKLDGQTEQPRAHDRRGGHDMHGDDPHVWLSPRLIRILADNIAEGLIRVDVENAQEYRNNLDSFKKEVDGTDTRIRQILGNSKKRTFFVFHPSFGYFGDEYGLRQKAIEVEGKTPTPRQIQSLIEEARDKGARIIFAQPQFDRRSAHIIAQAIGGRVVFIDPLAKNVLDNLEMIAANVKEAVDREE
jgi:zinc transport system substrate-binding protein